MEIRITVHGLPLFPLLQPTACPTLFVHNISWALMVESHDRAMPSSPPNLYFRSELCRDNHVNNEHPKLGAERHGRLDRSALPTQPGHCERVCVYSCVCVHIYECMLIYVCLYVRVCEYACVSVCTCVCVCETWK